MSHHIVEARDLHYTYADGTPGIRGVSFRITHGESVAIASVLSMSPDILVMDEPNSGLDPRARRRLIEQLKNFEHTKIIASHDLDMALDVCERTIVIHQGGVSADGPTLDILQDEALLDKSGLEKPLQMQNCPLCGPRDPESDQPELTICNTLYSPSNPINH